jgi:hypothetical protein
MRKSGKPDLRWRQGGGAKPPFGGSGSDSPRAYGHSRLPGVTACEARAPNDVGRCASRRSTDGTRCRRAVPCSAIATSLEMTPSANKAG